MTQIWVKDINVVNQIIFSVNGKHIIYKSHISIIVGFKIYICLILIFLLFILHLYPIPRKNL